METERIVIGCIISLIAILAGIYVFFTVRQKGPIFSNTYLWASKEERKNINRKAEYELVTVIFGCLTAIFTLLALHIFTLWKWPYVLMWVFAAFVVMYAIIDAIKTETRK